mmetsp:Transcript_46553/g.88885  ORF Transcript_46553/g.88885 Transcript_46553/m.88885 type:complete len:219 (-) Transcript_46553:307-963(-)
MASLPVSAVSVFVASLLGPVPRLLGVPIPLLAIVFCGYEPSRIPANISVVLLSLPLGGRRGLCLVLRQVRTPARAVHAQPPQGVKGPLTRVALVHRRVARRVLGGEAEQVRAQRRELQPLKRLLGGVEVVHQPVLSRDFVVVRHRSLKPLAVLGEVAQHRLAHAHRGLHAPQRESARGGSHERCVHGQNRVNCVCRLLHRSPVFEALLLSHVHNVRQR